MLQTRILLRHQSSQLLFATLQRLQLTLNLLFEAVILGNTTLQVALLILHLLFELFSTLFALLHALITLINVTVVLTFKLYKLLFRLQDSLLLNHLTLCLCLANNAL